MASHNEEKTPVSPSRGSNDGVSTTFSDEEKGKLILAHIKARKKSQIGSFTWIHYVLIGLLGVIVCAGWLFTIDRNITWGKSSEKSFTSIFWKNISGWREDKQELVEEGKTGAAVLKEHLERLQEQEKNARALSTIMEDTATELKQATSTVEKTATSTKH